MINAFPASHVLMALAKAVAREGKQADYCRKHGIAQSMLCEVLKGKVPISETVANSVGFVRRDLFIPVQPHMEVD